MTFKAAINSFFSAVSGAFRSSHTWRHDNQTGVRMCAICGRAEELVVDLMSTDWEVIAYGDPAAHASKAKTQTHDRLAHETRPAGHEGKSAAPPVGDLQTGATG